jgi:hypothetical protein
MTNEDDYTRLCDDKEHKIHLEAASLSYWPSTIYTMAIHQRREGLIDGPPMAVAEGRRNGFHSQTSCIE